jgi:hypothetical protein
MTCCLVANAIRRHRLLPFVDLIVRSTRDKPSIFSNAYRLAADVLLIC